MSSGNMQPIPGMGGGTHRIKNVGLYLNVGLIQLEAQPKYLGRLSLCLTLPAEFVFLNGFILTLRCSGLMNPSCGSVSDALLVEMKAQTSARPAACVARQPRQKPLPGDAGEPSQSPSVYGPSITGQPSSITPLAAARGGAKFI